MKISELASALSIPSDRYSQFRTAIKDLIASGEMVRLRRGRVGLAEEMDVVVGIIQIVRNGTGFVLRPGEEEDILVPPDRLANALDGDEVMVRLDGVSRGRKTATVIKIVHRSDRPIIGTFKKGGNFCSVEPDGWRIHRNIYIPLKASLGARDGEKVVAAIRVYDSPHTNPEGEVTERLGFPGQKGVDLKSIIRSHQIRDEFPREVLKEVSEISIPTTEELADREDLTDQCIFTIDPADAKDFDDAVSVERIRGGYRLGVHIADVSYYVREDTALDGEALLRGTSVYMPGLVIPMLPEELSNDICSLKPNRRRLAYSIIMDFDSAGKMTGWRMADSVIKSRVRLSYEEVQDFFDNKSPAGRAEKVADSLQIARQLARLLSRNRFAKGSLDFDLPEAKIILNDKGEVTELGSRVRLESHRLVEEFMLAANCAVAKELFGAGLPLLYRVHDRPDLERLEALSEIVGQLGYKFVVSKNVRPVDIANLLKKVEGHPEADFVNELALRSMKKAVYQRTNLGHFGLAFSHYAHFTSPIRRYPDLLIHRLLRSRVRNSYPPRLMRRVDSLLDSVGDHCSEAERLAERAEREAIKVKQAAYMAKQIGQEYSGVISGVISAGLFVRLDRLGAEGMVRISSIDDDYYHFEESKLRLIGRRRGKVYRLGQAVRVGVMRVVVEQRQIDLYLVPDKPASPKKKVKQLERKSSRPRRKSRGKKR